MSKISNLLHEPVYNLRNNINRHINIPLSARITYAQHLRVARFHHELIHIFQRQILLINLSNILPEDENT